MSDANAAGGAGDQQSGANADDKSKKDVVAYETYVKTVDEVKSLKNKLKEIEERDNLTKEKTLKEQNEWKALAEAKEKQLLEEKEKTKQFESTLTESFKISAFTKHLNGKLRSDEYFDHVDLDKIVFNPETKRVDEESVKAVVADFVKKHPHLIEFRKGKLPNESADGFKGTFPEEVKKGEHKDKLKSALSGWK